MRSTVRPTSQHSWLTFLFLVLVQLSAVRAVQDAGWLSHPAIIFWVSLAALVTGAGLARMRGPAELLHVGGLLAGVVVLAYAGASTLARGGLYDRLANIVQRIAKWIEVTSEGGIGTDNLLFLLFVAALAWLIGYAGAFAVFRYHHAWLTVIATGASLVITSSYAEGVSGYFFLFAPATILLFVEVHANRRERAWRLAGIQQARSLRGSFLRQGAAAALIVVMGSTWAPGLVSGAEFIGAWQAVDRPWIEMQNEFARLFGPVGGGSSPGASSYGSTLALQSSVALSDQPVMEVRSAEPRRLRGVIYDRYTGQGWLTEDRRRLDVPANGNALESASNDQKRVEVEQSIRVLRTKGDLLFAASLPRSVSLAVHADIETLAAGQGGADSAPVYTDLGAIRAAVGPYRGQEYVIKSAVSVATAPELRQSTGDYSQRLFQRYTALPRNFPRDVRTLARSLTAPYDNQYDQTLAIQEYLRTYTYTLSPSMPPLGKDIVEHFIFDSKEGYCDYFSTSMVVMLRSIGIPARVVAGYLPGEWDDARQAYLVRESDAHSWPEVYFSGYGWVEFEPTASAPAVVHPEGQATDQTITGAESGVDPLADDPSLFEDLNIDPGLAVDAGADAGTGGSGVDWNILLYLAGTMAFLLLFGRLALLFWERSFRDLLPAEATYAKMSTLGRLFGRGPRPYETPYEYSHQLARSVPVGERAIELIAHSFVRRRFSSTGGGEDGSQLVDAWRRLRLSLPRGLVGRWFARLRLLLPVRRGARP